MQKSECVLFIPQLPIADLTGHSEPQAWGILFLPSGSPVLPTTAAVPVGLAHSCHFVCSLQEYVELLYFEFTYVVLCCSSWSFNFNLSILFKLPLYAYPLLL